MIMFFVIYIQHETSYKLKIIQHVSVNLVHVPGHRTQT